MDLCIKEDQNAKYWKNYGLINYKIFDRLDRNKEGEAQDLKFQYLKQSIQGFIESTMDYSHSQGFEI